MNIEDLTYREMQKELAARGLSARGDTATLRQRLRDEMDRPLPWTTYTEPKPPKPEPGPIYVPDHMKERERKESPEPVAGVVPYLPEAITPPPNRREVTALEADAPEPIPDDIGWAGVIAPKEPEPWVEDFAGEPEPEPEPVHISTFLCPRCLEWKSRPAINPGDKCVACGGPRPKRQRWD